MGYTYNGICMGMNPDICDILFLSFFYYHIFLILFFILFCGIVIYFFLNIFNKFKFWGVAGIIWV